MFSKKQRIPRDTVKKVISEGQKSYSELFLFKKLSNNLNEDRFTIVISKKVSKSAVKRHKVRRKIKAALQEFYKTEKIDKNSFDDFVVIASPTISGASYKQTLEEIKKQKSFILK
jgi:ribonuclease P protein component